MTSFSSLPRLLGASVGLVLAALAASAISTGVGSAIFLGDEDAVAEFPSEEDDEEDDDAGTDGGAEEDDEDDDDDDDDDDETARAQLGGGPPTRGYLAKSIVKHNLFCPNCREVEREKTRRPDTRPAGPVPSQLPLELVATMVAKPADESIAIIAHSQTERSAPFRPHEHVLENVAIESVSRTRVILDHGGQLEFLDLNGRYCTEESPCDEGMGNCESDAQCRPGLVCAAGLSDVYRVPGNYSVCVPQACAARPKKPMTKSTCTEQCRCTSGMGDCDDSGDCLPNHVCASNNGPQFGKPSNWDVCVHEHCTNGEQDYDETGVDCGGSRCGDCL